MTPTRAVALAVAVLVLTGCNATPEQGTPAARIVASTSPSGSPSAGPSPGGAVPVTTAAVPPVDATVPTTKPTTKPTTPAVKKPATTRPPAPPPHTTAPASVYYANCAAVKAAGKAPLYRGQPGYRSGLDRDGDGVACEK